MKNKYIANLLLLPLLFGCVNTRIIDELVLVSVAGIDLLDDKMQVTAIYNHYTSDKRVENKMLEVIVDKEKNIPSELDKEASKPVLFGDMDVLILGMEAAEEAVFPIIDTLQRRADIGARFYLALTEEPVKELLSGNYEFKGNGQYIAKLIEHNVKYRDIPKTNFHLFSSDFFEKGKGTYLPILKRQGKDQLKITGLGLFDRHKLVHKISADQMFYFKVLVDKHNKSSMNVNVDHASAVIESVKTKTFINADYETLTVHIDYNMKGVLERYTGKRVSPKVLETVKKKIKKKIEKECLALLKEFQEMKIDPVGIERKFRQQNRDFDSKRWTDQYQDVKFIINSKVTIIETGTVE